MGIISWTLRCLAIAASTIICIIGFACHPLAKHNFPLLSSTQEPIIRKVYIDSNFSQEEIIYIQSAMNQWTVSTSGYFIFEILPWREDWEHLNTSQRNLLILKVFSNEKFVIEIENKFGHQIAGLASRHNGIETIHLVPDRIYRTEYFHQVMLHEIGHLIGINHTKEWSIMQTPVPIELNAPTEYDLNSVYQLYYRLF